MENQENALAAYTGSGLSEGVPTPSRSQRMTIEQVIAAWLDAKSKRTDSGKTHRAYTDTINQFRAVLLAAGLDLDSEPAIVATLAQGYAGRSVSDEGKDV